MRWWQVALVVIGGLVGSWGLLILLARRLPPGAARDLASVLPACATTVRRLWRDPRVPRSARLAVGFAALWVLSPLDLIPEFVPVIGPLDDVVVVALALRYAGRRVPRAVLEEAWPAEPRLLDRLLGPSHEPRSTPRGGLDRPDAGSGRGWTPLTDRSSTASPPARCGRATTSRW